MHDRIKVVRTAQGINLESLLKGALRPVLNVLPQDGDVFVAIGAGMLMPKSQGVESLVNDVPLVFGLATPSEVNVGPRPRLSTEIGGAGVGVEAFVGKVNVFRFEVAGNEFQHSRGLFDVT